MIITTKSGNSYDTEIDLTAPERHILQKLFLWETMTSSVDEFNTKIEEALLKGWNNSGPISGSTAFRHIVNDLKKKVILRVKSDQ